MSERESVPSPKVVPESQWQSQRDSLLQQEKELTRQMDRVNAARRRLPMVKLEKTYSFEGPDGNRLRRLPRVHVQHRGFAHAPLASRGRVE